MPIAETELLVTTLPLPVSSFDPINSQKTKEHTIKKLNLIGGLSLLIHVRFLFSTVTQK